MMDGMSEIWRLLPVIKSEIVHWYITFSPILLRGRKNFVDVCVFHGASVDYFVSTMNYEMKSNLIFLYED